MQKYNVFLHISQNVDLDTPYTFFFFGFLYHCYGAVGDAAGSTTLTRNRPRHYVLEIWVQHIVMISKVSDIGLSVYVWL